MKDKAQKYIVTVIACATLGLAPFTPEPHIVGKLRWILGGANGMTLIDWWDAFQHGAPWLALIYFAATDLFKSKGEMK